MIVTAAQASSGKSALVEALCFAITAQSPNYMSIRPKDETENAKALMTVAKAGFSQVVIDNYPNSEVLASAELDKYMTSQFYEGRLLGGNQNGKYPSNTMFFATGNNIEAGEDSVTRFMECRLEPMTDNPQNTIYKFDIDRMTEELRDQILSALIHILQAECEPMQQVGRFRLWFEYIAAPIMRASGELNALSEWGGKTTVKGGQELGEFLAELYAIEHKTKNDGSGLFAEECLRLLPEECGDVTHIPHDLLQVIAAPEDFTVPKDQQAANKLARVIAIKRAAMTFTKQMVKRKGQSAGGFRLVVGTGLNENRKERAKFHAVKL